MSRIAGSGCKNDPFEKLSLGTRLHVRVEAQQGSVQAADLRKLIRIFCDARVQRYPV